MKARNEEDEEAISSFKYRPRTMEPESDSGLTMVKVILWGIAIVIILALVLSCFYTIGAGERGVLLTFGKPDVAAKGEGLGFKIPLVQSVVVLDVKTQKYETDASAASKDLQIVTTKIAVNYHLVPENVPELYRGIGIAYKDRVIQPAVQEVVKASTAQFTAEELITKRPEVKENIKALLKDRLQSRGIIIEDINIVNFDFSESFNAAIESKVTAEQNALAAKNKLEQIKYEAEQVMAAAKGKAEAIKIEGDALKSNPQVVQLRALEKWNGVMPQVTGGAIPFIDTGRFLEE